ncbi:hypothetical protein GALMADRAFT_222071 [Galerina marginata CBS 339.88]|uniref:Secreted protein n=1 Tax=Galerina marginata (strain CBS 339.88) TaxID=685588 RepID=A0A067TQL8_GALM3|nr:hypothetical protein GALMADRAFT_222071 [Galerina marginata CBS 339.88]
MSMSTWTIHFIATGAGAVAGAKGGSRRRCEPGAENKLCGVESGASTTDNNGEDKAIESSVYVLHNDNEAFRTNSR